MICAITGYRPEKLLCGNDEQHPTCKQLKQKLFCEILGMTREGVSVFITGMSRGIDLWAAETILSIKDIVTSRQIELWAAIPYDRQAAAWSAEERARYEAILAKADRVKYISHEYTRACLHQRNRWMVDQATHLLGVYDGQPGGTRNTINYARKKGLNITIIEP